MMARPERPERPQRPAPRPGAPPPTVPLPPPKPDPPPTAASLNLGPALKRTEAELDAASAVTADDIFYARAMWRSYAPDGYEALLDATKEDRAEP